VEPAVAIRPKRSRVSQYFSLGLDQPSLDFVDVDIVGDVSVFIDPRALRLLHSPWGNECVSLIQNFFQTVLQAIQDDRDADAQRLLRVLREPNETHLGFSRDRARGRALGKESARDVWRTLSRSEAARSGLLEDLEDTILMVEGIAADIVSDITCNIIRAPLIEYTNHACATYGIPMREEVDSGPLWDPGERNWYSEFRSLPVVSGKKLLLVPKVIIRRKMDYDPDEYYRHYLLEELKEIELNSNSELVQLLKDGRRRVTKKDLEKKYGRGKAVIVRETLRHPEVLRRYRADKRRAVRPPLTHTQIADAEGTALPDWDHLLQDLESVRPGNADAHRYEKAIQALLIALFYPALANPESQVEIHEGRKRIDITFTNVATQGFFSWVAAHYAAGQVFVECKNYGGEIGNPELDQLAGRFSPSRGQVGLLVCREFKDKGLFLKRCRDTALDQRGYIIALDDDDLSELMKERRDDDAPDATGFGLLMKRFKKLVR
jgi:hypothetical protein